MSLKKYIIKDVKALELQLGANNNLLSHDKIPGYSHDDALLAMDSKEKVWDKLLPKIDAFTALTGEQAQKNITNAELKLKDTRKVTPEMDVPLFDKIVILTTFLI